MAEDGELFPGRVHLAQIFLVAGEVAASAGINQKRRAEIVGFPAGIARLDIHAARHQRRFLTTDQPSRTSAPGLAGVLQQNMIKGCALNLDGFRLAVEFALPENKARADGAIAQSELRAVFARKSRRLQRGQHAHVAENGHVARQERFTDVKARENFLFQHQHPLARPREKCGGAAAARTAPDDQRVISILIHCDKFDDVTNDGKLGKLRK